MFRISLLFILSFFASLALLSGKPTAPRVIGYLPDYRLTPDALANIPKCTDIVYFGSEILGDGTIKFASKDEPQFTKLKTTCQEHKVRLHLCLGGWKKDTHYPTVTSNKTLREKVIQGIATLKKSHGFHGVDYDWEYPKTEAEMKGFIALTRETKEKLGKNFEVTAAFHPRHQIPIDLAAQLDRIHLMTYDLKAPHCAIAHSQEAIKSWSDWGIPREKFCIGIAAYARNLKKRSDVKTYQQLFQHHGSTIHTSMPINGYFGDNQKSAQAKLKLAETEKLAGVIIWEIGQTPAGENSILKLFPAR